MNTILITGNTYPVKEQIKALGGKWSKAGQGWIVPAEVAEECRALVNNAPPTPPRRGYEKYKSHRFYFPSTGGELYQNKNGRCEDAPCCGCCS